MERYAMKYAKIVVIILTVFILHTGIFPAEVIKDIMWGHGVLVFDHQENIYIGFDSHSVTKYSPTGKTLLRIGRKGTGPGDVKRISSYAFNPIEKRLFITEYYNGNRWVSRFNTDGTYAGAWKFEMDWQKYDVVSSIHFDKDGNVFLLGQKSKNRRINNNINLGHDHYYILKFSPEGKFLKTFHTLSVDHDAEKRGNFQVTIPYHNDIGWVVSGNKLIVKESIDTSLTVYAPDGTIGKKTTLPFKREKVTEKDLDVWEKHMKASPFVKKMTAVGKADMDFWREHLPFPEYKPTSSDWMLADGKGNVFIREYTEYTEKDAAWFRVNLETGKTDKLTFKPGEVLCLIRNGYYYIYKVIDDDGEEVETITKLTESEFKKQVDAP